MSFRKTTGENSNEFYISPAERVFTKLDSEQITSILIPLSEYQELLEIKGRYLELRDKPEIKYRDIELGKLNNETGIFKLCSKNDKNKK